MAVFFTKKWCSGIAIVGVAAVVTFAGQFFPAANTQAAEQNSIVPDLNSGAEIYNSVCNGCHGVSIAPTLRGIINRPIASVESFAGYTDALKAKRNESWTKENINAFLAAPTEFAPGTDMVQVVAEAQKRADIIAFLEKLPPPRK